MSLPARSSPAPAPPPSQNSLLVFLTLKALRCWDERSFGGWCGDPCEGFSCTEASKLVMSYVAAVCGKGEQVNSVKEQLLQSNPVLEGENAGFCPLYPSPGQPQSHSAPITFHCSKTTVLIQPEKSEISRMTGRPSSFPSRESLFTSQPPHCPSPHLCSFWQCQDHPQQQLFSICE